MKINWKLRLQNKFTLTTLVLGFVAIVYQILGAFNVAPAITQNDAVQIIAMIIDLLVILGVVVDPTTKGISDSDRAMDYTEPN